MCVHVCNAMQGGTLRRATFSASALSTGLDYGASYGCASDDPSLIVTRAIEAAKFGEGASGWSGYSLLTNNCETFAYWCSTGRRVSRNKSCCGYLAREFIFVVVNRGGGWCAGALWCGGWGNGAQSAGESRSVISCVREPFLSPSPARIWWGRKGSHRITCVSRRLHGYQSGKLEMGEPVGRTTSTRMQSEIQFALHTVRRTRREVAHSRLVSCLAGHSPTCRFPASWASGACGTTRVPTAVSEDLLSVHTRWPRTTMCKMINS